MNKEEMDRLLEELRKEYKVELKPLTPPRFSVLDILEKYYDQIKTKVEITSHDSWSMSKETTFAAIRRTMCLKYGIWTLDKLPVEQREQFRKDLEDFITDFILKED